MSGKCPKCQRYLIDSEIENLKDGDLECSVPGCPVESSGGSFLLSAAIGAATGSALLGGLIGGDFTGGLLGDLLDGDLMD